MVCVGVCGPVYEVYAQPFLDASEVFELSTAQRGTRLDLLFGVLVELGVSLRVMNPRSRHTRGHVALHAERDTSPAVRSVLRWRPSGL